MGSHLGGIRCDGWDQESQAGSYFVFPLEWRTFREKMFTYYMEHSTV